MFKPTFLKYYTILNLYTPSNDLVADGLNDLKAIATASIFRGLTYRCHFSNDQYMLKIQKNVTKTITVDIPPKQYQPAYRLYNLLSELPPNERFILIFSAHGDGATIAINYNQQLSVEQIRDILIKAQKYPEVICFDCCLMSTVRTVQALSRVTPYIVAHQDLTGAHGFINPQLFNAIDLISPQKTALNIASIFMEINKTKAREDISVISTKGIKQLYRVCQKSNFKSTDNLLDLYSAVKQTKRFTEMFDKVVIKHEKTYKSPYINGLAIHRGDF